MKISGFTYIRNGFNYGYPFIPSIQSILPVVDELVVVVGDSTDGTREAIENLKENKIKIIDTIWDDQLRTGGKIFAEQANLGLRNISGDWAFHLQADEVIHEDTLERLAYQIKQADNNREAEGLLFPFLHFWGDYYHIRNTRRTHKYEIRAFRNTGHIFSYKDSQGFRKYQSKATFDDGEKGTKLKVIKLDIPVYHYSYARNPNLMAKKSNYFHRFWHGDQWLKENTTEKLFDFNEVDKLEIFQGRHPQCMNDFIAQKDWDFVYDKSKSDMNFKDKILNSLEKTFNHRFFEYQNYKLLKS